MWAAAQNHPDMLETLIEAHANLDASSRLGFTALHFAARLGDIESVRTLLAAGVDVNIRPELDVLENARAERARAGGGAIFGGSTALLVATVRGHVALALFLLDHGAD